VPIISKNSAPHIGNRDHGERELLTVCKCTVDWRERERKGVLKRDSRADVLSQSDMGGFIIEQVMANAHHVSSGEFWQPHKN